MFGNDSKEELKEASLRIREVEKELRDAQAKLKDREEAVQLLQSYLSSMDSRVNSLLELNSLVTKNLPADEHFENFIKLVVKALNCDMALVWLKEKNNTHYYLQAFNGNAPALKKNLRLPLSEGVVGWVIKSNEPLIVREISNETRFSKELALESKLNMFTVLILPITHQNEVIGAVELLNSQDKKRFGREDITLLTFLTEPAVSSFQHSENAAFLKREVQRLMALHEIYTLLNSTRDLKKIIQITTRILVKLLKAESCLIFFVDETRGDLFLVTGEQGARSTTRMSINQGVAGKVVHGNSPILLSDTSQEGLTWQVEFDRKSVKTFLALPLYNLERVVGVIELLNKNNGTRYTEADIHLFETISVPLTRSLESAKLFQELQRLSI